MRWRRIRGWLWWMLKIELIVVISWMLVTTPQRALAFSTTGYSRVVREAEMIAWAAARKASTASAAGAAAAAGASSFAWRAVTGPLGWAAVGVMTGMILWETFYSGSDLQDLKDAARGALPPEYTVVHPSYGTFTVPGPSWNSQHATVRPAAQGLHSACNDGGGPYDWSIGPYPDTSRAFFEGPLVGALRTGPSQTIGDKTYGYYVCHFAGSQGSATQNPPREPTGSEIADYLNALPESDPRSIPSHSHPVGANGSAQPAASTNTVPVQGNEVQSEVVPTSSVGPRDVVVKENEAPPAGSQTQTQTQQASTRTTSTMTNPDGSVTEESTEEATASCAVGEHDRRTLATVWEEHKGKWEASGLLGALNVLKNLTWPTDLPEIQLSSGIFGGLSVDFSQWSWAFVALRSLVIFGATIAAYRIIFVGG